MKTFTLKVNTGDVSNNFAMREIKIEKKEDIINLSIQGVNFEFTLQEWHLLNLQIASRDLNLLKTKIPTTPLNLEKATNITNLISSTAIYQLVLASVEITSLLNLIYGDSKDFYSNFQYITGKFIPKGKNGLYFLDSNFSCWYQDCEELTNYNQLCKLEVHIINEDNGRSEYKTYYVPYATPIQHKGFLFTTKVFELSNAAKELQESIKECYRTARGY